MSESGQSDPNPGAQFGHPQPEAPFGPPPPWKAEKPIWRRGWFLAVFFVFVAAGVILLLSSLFGSQPRVVRIDEQPDPGPGAVLTEPAVEAPQDPVTGVCRATEGAVRNGIVETLRGSVTPVVDSTVELAAGGPAPVVAMSVVLPNGDVAVGVWFAPPAGPVRAYDRTARRASTAPKAQHRERLDLLAVQARNCVPGF